MNAVHAQETELLPGDAGVLRCGDLGLGPCNKAVLELARRAHCRGRHGATVITDEIEQAKHQRLQAGNGGNVEDLAQRALCFDQDVNRWRCDTGARRALVDVVHRTRRVITRHRFGNGDVGDAGAGLGNEYVYILFPRGVQRIVDSDTGPLRRVFRIIEQACNH